MKALYVQVVKKEAVEIVIATFLHVFRHGITVSKQGDSRLKDRNGHCIITPQPAELFELYIYRYLVELYYHSKKVFLAIRRSTEVAFTTFKGNMISRSPITIEKLLRLSISLLTKSENVSSCDFPNGLVNFRISLF